MSTEPTPDTPESDLTGDGLRARDLAMALHVTAVRDHNLGEGPLRAICGSVESHLPRAERILAALPNREAAPAEGADATADAVLAGLDRANARLNREAAPREGWPSRDEFNRMSAAEINAFLASIGATQRVGEIDDAEMPNICAAASPYGGVCVKRPDHVAGGSDHWDGESHSWSVS